MMPAPSATRQDDERDLKMLDLRCAGYMPAEIAERFGMTRDAVSHKLRKIRKADIAESGEPDAAEGYC